MQFLKNGLISFIISFVSSLLFSFFDSKDISLLNEVMYLLFFFVSFFIMIEGYDYLNYDLNIKKNRYKIKKKIFLFILILLHIFDLLFILFIKDNSLKYLLLIPLFLSNIYSIFLIKSRYFYSLEIFTLLSFNLVIYFNIYKLIVIFGLSLFSVFLIYYLTHRKTKVYTYDNY